MGEVTTKNKKTFILPISNISFAPGKAYDLTLTRKIEFKSLLNEDTK